MRTLLLRTLMGLVFLSVVLFGVIGWIGSERALHPGYRHYRYSLATFPDLHPELVRVPLPDQVTLNGEFFRGARPALVILASGYGDTEDQMLGIAEFLHRAGFSTMVYNSRARATSGGAYVTLGALEQKDLIALVTHMCSQPGIDADRIGVLGISMGGSVALLAAAHDPQIRAVVDDSGFSDAPRVIAASFQHFIHLPAFPFAPITVAIASQRAGIDLTKVRPMDVVGQISPRPLLIIHETDDLVVPADNSRRNFAAARQPKQLWMVSGDHHGQAHIDAQGEYESRVIAFFNKALN